MGQGLKTYRNCGGGNIRVTDGFPVLTWGEMKIVQLDPSKTYGWFGGYFRSDTYYRYSYGTVINGVLSSEVVDRGNGKNMWNDVAYDAETGTITFGPGHSGTPAAMVVFEIS